MDEDKCEFKSKGQNGRCLKQVTHIVTFPNNRHIRMCQRHTRMQRTIVEANGQLSVVRKMPISMHIDEKSNNVAQCCVRTKLSDPLCTRRTIYNIEGRYFCGFHARRHPRVRDSSKVLVYGNNDRQMQLFEHFDIRLTKIEHQINQIHGWLEHLIRFQSFRDSVYAIGESTSGTN